MERYAGNVLVLIKVKLMECWADSVWPCIFHFWKCVTQGIKAPFGNKAADLVPPKLGLLMSFSLSLSFSLFSGWSPGGAEGLWVHFFARASKTLYRRRSASLPHREGAWGLREQSKSHVRGFIGFLCKPRNISLFLSPFTFISLADTVHPEGIPGSCWGWTLALHFLLCLQVVSGRKTLSCHSTLWLIS